MNKAIIMGRLVRDPEMRTTKNDVAVASFTLAVDRRFRNANGEREADFIPCVAWRNQADFAANYLQKGAKVVVSGAIQTRSWEDQDGKRRTATEIIVDEIEFAESKKRDSGHADGIPDDIPLPFEL